MPFKLHAVIIDKKVPLKDAKRIAQDIIKDKTKTFYRETKDSWRFRNIPKTKFIKNKFATKVVNPKVSLVFGHLKT